MYISTNILYIPLFTLFLTVPGSPQNVQVLLHQDTYNVTWDPVDTPSVFYQVSLNSNTGYMSI